MDYSPTRIILADDDQDDLAFFREALSTLQLNHTLDTFSDGKKLMDYLNDPKNPLPHLLFLDLNMPCKTGMECLEEIRNNPRFKDISIAIYSTSSSNADLEATFIKGANIYIKKPSNFTKLKEVLNEVVNLNWQHHTSGLNKDTFLFSI
ncbi:response regulator [Flavobacterium sp. NST-5]|uniref:Response regulator n=1 Tax=Flavobacterium ichthyis TaxID=2698827 RepID=A0ABW9Z8G1_9FLAO|nr:response regulator [Flavobacterium ichthyis]NBL64129.1 response regulator [Flavobacterium ichthyis]